MHIQELLQKKIESMGLEKNSLTKRNTLIKELYEVYALENKFENYYRYRFWLKKNNKKKCNETVTEFKKVKLPINFRYIKPITPAFFAIKLSFIPTEDLYYLISIKKDSVHRQGYKKSSFTKWLFYSIKPISKG